MYSKFFDLHCDTAGTAFLNGVQLEKNTLSVDFERMTKFNCKSIFAIWVAEHTSPLQHFIKVADFIKKSVDTPPIIISAEGGDVLEGDIENIAKISPARVLTLTWNGENELGYGAHCDSTLPLKDFGKRTVAELEKNGITVDVSHLNEGGFKDLCKIAQKPFVATHSNAHAVCQHPRNLKDWQIKEISQCGGIIGLNVYTLFLNDNPESATIDDIILHAEHILNLTNSHNLLAIGTDFDGMKSPVVEDISKIPALYQRLEDYFGTQLADKIVYENANNFFEKGE